MFCVSDKVSGGEIYTIELLSGLAQLGWNVRLVGIAGSGLEGAVADRNIEFVPTRLLGPKLGKRTAFKLAITWLIQVREFRRIIRAYPHATIILQYKLEQLLWGCMSERRRCVYLEHGPIPEMITKPMIRSIYRRGLRNTSATFAASHPASRALERMGATPYFIAAGVDEQRRLRALASVAEVRQRLGAFVDADCIGIYAGRITAEKGVLDAARLCMESQNLGLVIFGVGPQLGDLQELIAGSGRVRYMGVTNDALPLIAASDFGVLLTRDSGEGRPLFAVESLSVGTPIIGLIGSAAMHGLQREFTADSVRLIAEADSTMFTAALTELPEGVLVDVRTWSEACALAHKVLGSHLD